MIRGKLFPDRYLNTTVFYLILLIFLYIFDFIALVVLSCIVCSQTCWLSLDKHCVADTFLCILCLSCGDDNLFLEQIRMIKAKWQKKCDKNNITRPYPFSQIKKNGRTLYDILWMINKAIDARVQLLAILIKFKPFYSKLTKLKPFCSN